MDTPTKLANFLGSRSSTPFQWGVNDCCLFAADWVKELTGADPMEDFRGAYSTPLEAARRWAAVGGYAPEGERRLLALGWEPIPPALAQRGAVVLIDSHKRHTTFGVMDARPLVLSPLGLSHVGLGKVIKAWRKTCP